MNGNLLAHSWARAWNALGLEPPPRLCERLLAAYGEPRRHYHSVRHLSECVAHFGEASDLARHPGEVEIALWFHDAVYDPEAKDNELRSAEWAVEALSRAGAGDACRARVRDLILATRHEAIPVDADQQLLVDIDLAILGAGAGRFAEYDAQIRREYEWVPGALYDRKRREVLQAFLDRRHLYGTDRFRQRFEARARANLAAALARAARSGGRAEAGIRPPVRPDSGTL